jgi:pimeloyl-ACP methyl ester carboxylesterase
MRREALALLHVPAMSVFRDTSARQLISAWSSAPIRAAISTWDLIAALDLLGSLPHIHIPLLLLYGSRDAIVKPALAAQVRAAAPSHAAFRLVRGASHLTLFLRRDVQTAIADWFAQQLGTTTLQ